MFGVFEKRTRTPIFHPSFSTVLVNLSVFGAQSVEKIYIGILFMKVEFYYEGLHS